MPPSGALGRRDDDGASTRTSSDLGLLHLLLCAASCGRAPPRLQPLPPPLRWVGGGGGGCTHSSRRSACRPTCVATRGCRRRRATRCTASTSSDPRRTRAWTRATVCGHTPPSASRRCRSSPGRRPRRRRRRTSTPSRSTPTRRSSLAVRAMAARRRRRRRRRARLGVSRQQVLRGRRQAPVPRAVLEKMEWAGVIMDQRIAFLDEARASAEEES